MGDNKDKNPLGREHAFPYGDIITFWSVFLEIEPIMWRALAINTCVLFVLTAFFLKSIFVAIVSVIVCGMIVMEVYGVMMILVQYNSFVVTGLIAASGLAIEDVAHFVAAFTLTEGSTNQKLVTAMKHTFVAIILGSASTFVALLPLSLHYMEFVFFHAIMATFGVLTEKPKQYQKSGDEGSV